VGGGVALSKASMRRTVSGVSRTSHFSMPDRLHDFIQGDLFFNHLLLRVLRYPEGSGRRSGLDASEQGFEFDSVGLPHSISSLAQLSQLRTILSKN
jgi:hypothetical protein